MFVDGRMYRHTHCMQVGSWSPVSVFFSLFPSLFALLFHVLVSVVEDENDDIW